MPLISFHLLPSLGGEASTDLGAGMGWSQPTQILEFVGIPCHLVLLWTLPWVFGFAIVSCISFSFSFGAGRVDEDFVKIQK